jgi:hypothetical protein
VAVPVLSLLQGVTIAELAQLADAQLLAAGDPAAPPQPGAGDLSDQEVDDLLGLLEPGFPADQGGR